jgi:hypothetical protein
MTYHFVTDNVAISTESPSYEDFDVIVNLNCYWNGINCDTRGRKEFSKLDIVHKIYKTYDDKIKYVYYIGIQETEGNMQILLEGLMPVLVFAKQVNPSFRFLFHCKKGMAKSMMIAIAFLIKGYHMNNEDVMKAVFKYMDKDSYSEYESNLIQLYPYLGL